MSKKNRIWRLPAVLSAAAAATIALTILPEKNAPLRSELSAPPKKQQAAKADFVPLQFTLLPNFLGSLFNPETPVYGLSLGGMVSQKELYGLSIAGIHAYNDKKAGVSMALLDACKESYGLSFAAGGGAVRNHGCAFSLWNLAEHNDGVQIGLFNQVKPRALIDCDIKRDEKPEGSGVQAGLVNYSEGKGLQFGLWNTNPNGFLKHFPFFNIAL